MQSPSKTSNNFLTHKEFYTVAVCHWQPPQKRTKNCLSPHSGSRRREKQTIATTSSITCNGKIEHLSTHAHMHHPLSLSTKHTVRLYIWDVNITSDHGNWTVIYCEHRSCQTTSALGQQSLAYHKSGRFSFFKNNVYPMQRFPYWTVVVSIFIGQFTWKNQASRPFCTDEKF